MQRQLITPSINACFSCFRSCRAKLQPAALTTLKKEDSGEVQVFPSRFFILLKFKLTSLWRRLPNFSKIIITWSHNCNLITSDRLLSNCCDDRGIAIMNHYLTTALYLAWVTAQCNPISHHQTANPTQVRMICKSNFYFFKQGSLCPLCQKLYTVHTTSFLKTC